MADSERQRALDHVWAVLSSPLVMMSRPSRADALKQARAYNLTVVELIEFVHERRRRA
jgi:hypothetical protein